MTPFTRRIEGFLVTFSRDRHNVLVAHEGEHEVSSLFPSQYPGVKLPELLRKLEERVQHALAHQHLERQERRAKRVRFRWLSPSDFARRFPAQVGFSQQAARFERWHLFVRVPRYDGFCPWGERNHRADIPQRLRVGGYLRVAVWEGWDNEPILVRAWDYDDGYWRQPVTSRYAARELVNRMITLTPLHIAVLYALGFRHE